jgi:hypothetical protein
MAHTISGLATMKVIPRVTINQPTKILPIITQNASSRLCFFWMKEIPGVQGADVSVRRHIFCLLWTLCLGLSAAVSPRPPQRCLAASDLNLERVHTHICTVDRGAMEDLGDVFPGDDAPHLKPYYRDY